MRFVRILFGCVALLSTHADLYAGDSPKILLVYDMEGISGVTTPDYQRFDRPAEYRQGQQALTSDVNAAIRGLKAGGAGAIWVQDGHGSGNEDEPDILLDQMDRRATFDFRPYPYEPYSTGLDGSIAAAVYVGAHARANTSGFMAHTFFQAGLRVNGVDLTETHVLALSAARWGIPVIMVSGDSALGEQLRDDFPEIEYAEAKTARGWSLAEPVPGHEAELRIENAAQRAITKFLSGGFRPYHLPSPYEFELTFQNSDEARLAAGDSPFSGPPKVRRVGETAVRFTAKSFFEGFQTSLAVISRALTPLPLLLRVLEHHPEGRRFIMEWQDLLNVEPGGLPEWALPARQAPVRRRFFGAS